MKRRKPRLPRRLAVQANLELPEPPSSGSPDDLAPDLPWWQRTWAVAALAAIAAVLLLIAILSLVRASRDRELAGELEGRVKTLTLRAATQERVLRVAPNPRSWSATPDATIRWPEPPELLDLYLPVAYSEFKVFAVTIDKVDSGRVVLVQRMVPDSNRELRLTINSTAFQPGEYRIRLQGYTWRGQRVDAGWVRLVVK